MIIDIIFEDPNLLVVNKPAGITVNKSDTTRGEETIQDWAEKKLKITSNPRTVESDFYNRGGVVHRLDKETSGVLILAKTPEAFSDLQRQFKERLVEKTYVALAHGKVMPMVGEINVPVARLPWNRTHFGVVPGGRESMTVYKVKSYYEYNKEIYSYLEVYPKTGRTHQIRVHLKYLGFPIFADFLYAGRKTSRNDRKLLSRVFLHASKLSCTHPLKGEKLNFTAPLPEDLSGVLHFFRKV